MNATLPVLSSRGEPGSRAIVSFLQHLELFEGLGGRVVESLASAMTLKRLPRGAVLWRPEESTDEVMWVRSGVVRVTLPTGTDREVTVGYFGRGELIGVHGGGRGEPRGELAEVHEDAALLSVPRAAFDRWLMECPTAIRPLLDMIAERFCRLQARLALVSMHGAKARLAGLLLDLGERFGVRDSRGVIIDLRLTHRELASLIGATRETVSVAIVELRNEGVLRTEQRRIILLDEPKLRVLAAGT